MEMSPREVFLCLTTARTGEGEEREEILSIAKKAYAALDASGLARVDFFMDKKSGEIYLNEINTLPGFTSISMFPKMCEHAGISFTEITEILIQEGLLRFKATRNLQTSR